MASPPHNHFLIVGAGAAGLMAGRELLRAGKKVTILEARERCGGRIHALRAGEFGYAAEGGAEFIHGEAPVTRALLREAGLALAPVTGRYWNARSGTLTQDESPAPHSDRLYRLLAELGEDLPIAEFLETHFAGKKYAALRRSITGMVEGYDAADPKRASTFALRDEWMGEGLEQQGRVAEGYGALIDYLAAEYRRQGASIRLGAQVTEIDQQAGGIVARIGDGTMIEADAAILTVPLPLWTEIALPAAARARAATAAADIGFGNVVKILLRFETKWWADLGGRDLADLSFLFSNVRVPTWWTQNPADHPLLTGWFAGPKADTVGHLDESGLVGMGLDSLAAIFDLPRGRLTKSLVAAKAINWGADPFARGAYSYATPQTRTAQAALQNPDGSAIFFSGEALYAGRDMGTVEAALASGRDTARMILAAGR
jgi:monoamine oxidase